MLAKSENLFMPKLVVKGSDWLDCMEEKGQTIEQYSKSGPEIFWLNPQKANTIYLFIIDDSIDVETGEKFKRYCQAFYHGIQVKLVRPGDEIKQKLANGRTIKKKLPTDYLSTHNITTRNNGENFQLHAGEILNALKGYKADDTYCILAITNQDLYPRDSWYFVFGITDDLNQCGIFSFFRHIESCEIQELSESDSKQVWMKRSCSTMVHEIGHMFGLEHCIYYECTMNGSNGSAEDRYPDRTLCPVCLAKIKLNAKFDCRERFLNLIEVCNELGFSAMAESHLQVLAAVEEQSQQ